jgi:MtrB/PioB family decaheme-associated outer membrane protein
MHRRVPIHLICWLLLMAPVAVRAQTAAQPPALSAGPSAAAGEAPAQASPDAAEESSRSLFEPALRQFSFGGRLTSVSGDPARFQRYQDLRDGVLFTDARYTREDPGGSWLFRATADNVGWRDQRYSADYERTGRFVISGLWDEIPQFYSIDTRTPFTTSAGDLVLDDAAQRAAQTGQTDRSVYVPIAPQFDLKERRDIGHVSFLATPTPQFDVKATFTTNRHVGELPWGASFGFSNDVEVALPYDSRTNDFTIGAEWTNGRNMLRVAYDGSWFDNLDPVLVWDSPLRLDDSTSAPGRGRMTLWPSNSSQTVSVAGYSKFARRTQVTGLFSFGVWNNDEPLQPFTINPTLPQLTLPRTTTDAEAHVFNTNVSLVSRPAMDWRFSARLRRYDYNNLTGHTNIPEFINYDTSVTESTTSGPEPYAHDRTNFDADATYTGLGPVAVTGGYAYNHGGYAFRIFDNTGENVVFVSADAVGSQWVTFRARYDHAERTGSGVNEDLLLQIGEQPGLRHYDVADRNRNQFTGQVDVVPNELWIFSASAGVGKDEYDDSEFGLQESTFRTLGFGVDYRQQNGLGAGASYNYERYAGLQRSRQANPGQENDPLRDWTADSTERVDYFSIYITPPKMGRTEARLSYDYSYAKGSYLYGIAAGGPLTPPNQLPNVYNKLQQLHVDVRHRLSGRLAASFSYLYEPFRVYDFAFDQTVVDSIVQPSSLVLGYVYRPYTAHSAVLSLRYFWP